MKIGKITRPENGAGDKKVTLTATITKGETTAQRMFTVNIKQQGLSDTQCVAIDKASLDIVGKDAIKAHIILPTTGENGTTITWESASEAVVSSTGFVNRPANGQPEAEVVLKASIEKGLVTDTKEITVTVLPWTDEEEVDIAFEALTWDVIRGNNLNDQSIKNNLVLDVEGSRETTIVWASSNQLVIAADGTVNRPTYTAGDSIVSLSATITKGAVSKVKQFLNFKVSRQQQTNEEAVTLGLASVTDTTIKGTNPNLLQVIDNLTLPKVPGAGVDAPTVTFSWSQVKKGTQIASTYFTIVDAGANLVGSVTRPSAVGSNEEITLTLTATSTTAGGASATQTKVFEITILKQT